MIRVRGHRLASSPGAPQGSEVSTVFKAGTRHISDVGCEEKRNRGVWRPWLATSIGCVEKIDAIPPGLTPRGLERGSRASSPPRMAGQFANEQGELEPKIRPT